MYTEKGKVSNCYYYSFFDKILITKVIEGNSFIRAFDNYNLRWEYALKSKLSHTPFVYNNNIYLYENKRTVIIDAQSGQLVRTEERLYLHKGDKYDAYIDVFNPDRINIKASDFSSSIDSSNSSIDFYDGYLLEYPYDSKRVKCFLVETGEKIWDKAFEDLLPGGEVNKYGSVVNVGKLIYMYISDNENIANRATISIDIQTGKVCDIYPLFFGELMLYKNKIYVANFDKIKVLDLKTKEIIEHDLRKVLSKSDLQIHWNTYKVADDKLFFIDGHSVTSNRLGVLDLISMELVWEKEIEIDDDINKNIQEIRVSENKLFVYCSDQSLHIFERL